MYGDYYNNTGMVIQNVISSELKSSKIYRKNYTLTKTPRDVKVKLMKMLVKIKI